MKFFRQLIIICYSKWLLYYIKKDLLALSGKAYQDYSEFTEYRNIERNINILIDKHHKIREKKNEPFQEVNFKLVLKQSGKGTRIVLTNFVLRNKIIKDGLGKSKFKIYRLRLCQIIEAIHNLSLIVDDELDNDHLRRNKPCAHIQYGKEGLLLLIKYWLNLIFYLILDLPITEEAKKMYLKILDNTCIDIIKYVEKEIAWEKNLLTVNWEYITEKEIEEIYYQKTVRIFILGFDLIQQIVEFSDKERNDYIEIITKLGFYLQRINDLETFNINNSSYLSDIKNKRIILLNFNKQIKEDSILTKMRHRAYSANATDQDIETYGKLLWSKEIIKAEINQLKYMRAEIQAHIIATFNSNWDRDFLMLIFEIYSKKLIITDNVHL